ncbi:DUF5758 domain-containing protein [Natrinema sp. DC36]|uniref:DUF5758 domain-containing protein n=1 Tax=Natrinema sp. DC36 TaxID=2878680 RepID=UPI001CEFCBDB|nr:DUF5758 domain-containing protein [Natrinema sp. DC36]
MLGLARSSTVAELKDELEETEQELSRAERRKSTLRRMRDSQREREQDAVESLKAALEAGEFDNLEDESCKVEELDEPRVVWKKGQFYIIELVIPAGETVVHTTDSKKRVSKAYVREFYHKHDGPVVEKETEDRSIHDHSFTYRRGRFVEPDGTLDTQTWRACTRGIHCFATREEAADYFN